MFRSLMGRTANAAYFSPDTGGSGGGEDRRYLSTQDAADVLGLAKRTLVKDRQTGHIGIPFIKLGPKLVLYDRRAIDEHVARCQRRSTSDPGAEPRAAKRAKQEIRAST